MLAVALILILLAYPCQLAAPKVWMGGSADNHFNGDARQVWEREGCMGLHQLVHLPQAVAGNNGNALS